VWAPASGGPGALLVSPFNVEWRFSALAGDVEGSKLCLFSVIMPAKCVSSISPRFHYRRPTFCFLPLANILESSFQTLLLILLPEAHSGLKQRLRTTTFYFTLFTSHGSLVEDVADIISVSYELFILFCSLTQHSPNIYSLYLVLDECIIWKDYGQVKRWIIDR
jgi:hypothetical protein